MDIENQPVVCMEVQIGSAPECFGTFKVERRTPSIKPFPYLYFHFSKDRLIYVGEAATLRRLKSGFGNKLGAKGKNVYHWREKYHGQTIKTYAFRLSDEFKTRDLRLALEAEVLFKIRTDLNNWPIETLGFQPRSAHTNKEIITNKIASVFGWFSQNKVEIKL